jgi:hypothetical protein
VRWILVVVPPKDGFAQDHPLDALNDSVVGVDMQFHLGNP